MRCAVLALLPLALACRPAGTLPERLTVERGQVRDSVDRAVVLRGFNLSSVHKQPPYFDFHEGPDFARIRTDWGMNSVRFLLQWAAVEPQPGAYDDAYLDAVRARLDLARDAGLHVVLDMHQDVFGAGFPGGNGAPRWACDEARYAAFVPRTPWFANYTEPNVVACFDAFWQSRALQDAYAAMWGHVAEVLADHPAVVGLDPMNEPSWGSMDLAAFEANRLGPLYEAVVAQVRRHAPDWLAFLEPSSSRNVGVPTRLPAFGFGGVVYAPHSYYGPAEAGGGFDPQARQAVVDTVAALKAEAATWGGALWIGEFGGVAGHPGILEYMDAAYDAQAAVGAGGAYWHYGRDDGYGFLDADGNEKPALASALVRPWPERVAGDDPTWSWDEATRVFHLSFTPGFTQAPTELSVPARLYPEGFQVECGDCRLERVPGRVRVWRASGGITLRP